MNAPNPNKPWSRRANESSDSYESFIVYRDLGPKRSIDLASKKCNKNASILGRWSTRFGWVERSLAWDDFLQSERDRVAVAEAAKWEKRRIQAAERNWLISQKIQDKIENMLDFPLHRTKTSRDGQSIIHEPARWNLGTVALLVKTALDVEMAALEATTPELAGCTDEELRAIEDAALDLPGEGGGG